MSTLVGISPISDFTSDEIVRPSEVPSGQTGIKLDIAVPIDLTERRIFSYVEVKQSPSNASYIFASEIEAWYNASRVGRFPCNIGDVVLLTTNQSIGSLFNAGGSPVGDSYALRLNNPFDTTSTGIQNAVLQPLRINAKITRLTFRINAAQGANLVGWRAFLGCLSTRYA